jgi:NADH dehydrogenase
MTEKIESDRPRVVILGGGFGGIYTALYLQSEAPEESAPEVLLIDRHNYFLFSPLLHEVATGGVDLRNVAQAILPLSRQFGFRFLQAEIAAIDVQQQRITTSCGVVQYDILVIALGSVAQAVGVEGAADYALTLKTLSDARRLRNRILGQFAAAAVSQSAEEKRQKLTFVLVGGGPTGVELACEVVDYARKSLLRTLRQNLG